MITDIAYAFLCVMVVILSVDGVKLVKHGFVGSDEQILDICLGFIMISISLFGLMLIIERVPSLVCAIGRFL